MNDQYSPKYSKGAIFSSQQFAMKLISSNVLFCKLWQSRSLWTLNSIFSTQGCHKVLCMFPFSTFCPRYSTLCLSWATCRVHIIPSPSVSNHYSSLSSILYVENHSLILSIFSLFIFLLFVFVSHEKVNLVFCYSILDRKGNPL